KMADENVPAPAPTRSDDQILPFAAWVPIEKSNYVLDLQKKQKNPIFHISNTLTYEANTKAYSFELDETRFVLDANLLREALEITPIDQAHQFVSPPSGDAIMDFVNELGYTEVIHFVSRMVVNYLYQPWRAILSMINQCLTGKTFGHDRPRYPVLQMLWGIITSTNVDYAELMWEEFIQAIQTFLTDKANLGSLTKKGRKDKAHTCQKGRKEKTASVKKPDHNLLLYKPATEKSSKPAPVTKPKVTKEKPSNPSTAKPPKPKPAKEKSTKATPLQKVGKGKATNVRNVKSSFQLVDEPDKEPAQPEPEPETEYRGESEEYDVERAFQMSLESFQAQGQAHVGGVAIREPIAEAIRPLPIVEATEEASTGPFAQPHDDTSANIVRNSLFPVDAETKVNLEDKTAEIDEGQARSDPGKTPESRPPPDV
ncbi:hypothetical protein Tco_1022373, partial [Tanacetum coccineum]